MVRGRTTINLIKPRLVDFIMKILGIHDSHDCGIALIEDNEIKFVVNEERLNRIKVCLGFPRKSIEMMINRYNVNPSDIDKIAIGSHYLTFIPYARSIEKKDIDDATRAGLSILSRLGGPLFKTDLWVPISKSILSITCRNRKNNLKKILRGYGFKCPIEFVDHHASHAASAYFTGGKYKALVITSDSAADGLSATISIGKEGKLERIGRVNSYNSLGKLYQYVTEICGFKVNKHEGKITGLAAYGKPIYLELFNKMIKSRNGGFVNISNSKHKRSKEKILEAIGPNYKREDLAASVQQHLENETIKFVKYWLNKTKLKDLVLAGGVFANVKLNQRILELEDVDSVYIHPNMGDGGLALGAAFLVSGQKPINVDDAYYGPEYSEEEIEDALKEENVKYKKYNNVEKEIAKLLSKKKVIARFNGRMEYGPRALGNRSILYHAGDKSVNDWLNKRLKRTEFMPFAPVTMEEYKDDNYLNNKGGDHAAKFMTITFDCGEEMKKKCPAVVHVDGTARPQLINEKINPSYYNIVKEYHKLTKIPTIVNTSFNMHEEPIVCSPEDAIRSFKQGNLDYLAIGNFIVANGKI